MHWAFVCVRISTLGTQVEMLQQSKNGFINILYPPGKTVRSGCDGVNDAVTKVTTTCNCNLSSSPPHTHTPHTHTTPHSSPPQMSAKSRKYSLSKQFQQQVGVVVMVVEVVVMVVAMVEVV